MKNVLLIEDDRLVAEIEEMILTADGICVSKVETLDEARDAMTTLAPDLVLSDLQLAEGTAEDTIRFLGEITGSVPVVICSGHFGSTRGLDLRKACASAGCMDYVEKRQIALKQDQFTNQLRDSYNRFHAAR
jgi:DNA-binding NtrC family response regulator